MRSSGNRSHVIRMYAYTLLVGPAVVQSRVHLAIRPIAVLRSLPFAITRQAW